MDKNTQQPVAWRVTHIDDQDEQYIAAWDKRRVAHFQASPAAWEMTPLYIAPPAPPVPRGVLMAALEEYHGKVSKFLKGEGGPADVNEVADRYASKVPPEPVNQQMLAALKLAESVYRKNVVVEGEPSSVLSAMQAAIAAAEAAQPVVQDGYAQGVEAVAKMLEKKADDFASENGYDDMGSLSFGGNLNGELMREYHSGLLELAEEVRAMKTDCQQPASSQPVAVPDEITVSMAPHSQYAKGWNACRSAMLSAAQKPECWCHTCRPVNLDDMRMVLCPDCGNKRCPRANDHRNACTGSNEPGQAGSAYTAAQKGGAA